MPKTIVVLCDGTGNTLGRANTNVYKVCQVLEKRRDDQVVYYDPGVGTLGEPSALTRVRNLTVRAAGAMFGVGLSAKACQAYDFISQNHRTGDQLFLFGFSRGAYTVRAVASLIHMYGLSTPGATNIAPHLFGLMEGRRTLWQALRGKKDDNVFRAAGSFKKHLGRQITIDFMGLFDTVNSVGTVDPLSLPHSDSNPSVRCVRHAVSIGERRAFFRPELMIKADGQDFKEVWFCGVHSDVGGGYSHDEQGLAQRAFRWMIGEALSVRGPDGKSALHVNASERDRVLCEAYGNKDYPGTWHTSLTWFWWFLEIAPKWRGWVGYRYDPASKGWKSFVQLPCRFNIFRRRHVPDNAVLHHSVEKLSGVFPERWFKPLGKKGISREVEQDAALE